MNHFIFFVSGQEARNYLGDTNYVGVWADTLTEAAVKVKQYFAAGTPIFPATKNQVSWTVGYLY